MSTFLNSLKKSLNHQFLVKTENGALGYRSSNNALVDFNFKLPSYRENLTKVVEDFVETINVDPTFETSLRYLFYLRDIRGGLGERAIFREVMRFLVKTEHVSKELLELIPEFGRWDDLIVLYGLNRNTDKLIVEILNNQLSLDWSNFKQSKEISLLAKWMPSIYDKSKHKKLAQSFAAILPFFKGSEVNYRKNISKLREYLRVVERDMCRQNWREINYNTVPSKANIVYRNAFLRHDNNRRLKFLDDLKKGNAKINSSVNFPHDIVARYFSKETFFRDELGDFDETLEQLWKNLPDFEGGNDVLVVADTSGSMFSRQHANVIPAYICFALATYFAERANGPLKDKVMLFSSKPYLIDLSTRKSLRAKLHKLISINDCSNTNIEKVFNILLSTALDNSLTQEELPKSILVISDMEFDFGKGYGTQSLFNTIKHTWESNGYKLPKLVFWNVASRTNTFPITENDLGITYLSGYSTNLVKLVLSNKFDPFEALKEQIFTERYNKIGEIAKTILKINK